MQAESWNAGKISSVQILFTVAWVELHADGPCQFDRTRCHESAHIVLNAISAVGKRAHALQAQGSVAPRHLGRCPQTWRDTMREAGTSPVPSPKRTKRIMVGLVMPERTKVPRP